MKKNYLIPQMEVITFNDNHLLAGSTDSGAYADQSDAPAMMNLPEENVQTEFEE